MCNTGRVFYIIAMNVSTREYLKHCPGAKKQFSWILASETGYIFTKHYHHHHHHHPVVCLMTGSKPLPKRSLHILRSKASSFKWAYPLLSSMSSSSFLRLLHCLLVTSISPFIFPSITCFRRQFLRSMWPIQLAFRFRNSRRIFLCSLTRSNTSSLLTWSIQLIFSILLQHHISKLKISKYSYKYHPWGSKYFT